MRQRFLRDVATFLVASLCGACNSNPIEWSEPTPLPQNLAAATDLAFDARQDLVARAPDRAPVPVVTGQCTGSVRAARDTTGDWYAVWWSVRSDSTGDIVMSRSSDGVHWTHAVTFDSTAEGRGGCQLPAPSLYADGANIYVAYAMAAREGPGIFASHSMDRGMTFHSPVVVVYGAHIGGTAIAAQGDAVAVAYEDPNSDPQRVAVAFTRTMGHLFETHEIVSPPTGAARDPRIAVGKSRIAVMWAPGVAGTATDASAPRMMRIGSFR